MGSIDTEHATQARRFLTGACGCATCGKYAQALYPRAYADWCRAHDTPIPLAVVAAINEADSAAAHAAATWRPPRAWVGMDLGKRTDHSAIAVLVPAPPDHPSSARLVMTTWARLPKGMDWTSQVDRSATLIGHLRDYCAPHAQIGFYIDGTGVGDAVVEMFRAQLPGKGPDAVRVMDCKITAGNTFTRKSSRQWNISKTQLIAPLQSWFLTGDIEIAELGEYTRTVKNELVSYTVRPSAVDGNPDQMDNGKDSAHDDLVIAGALAAFAAARQAGPLQSSAPAVLRHVPAGAHTYSNVYKR